MGMICENTPPGFVLEKTGRVYSQKIWPNDGVGWKFRGSKWLQLILLKTWTSAAPFKETHQTAVEKFRSEPQKVKLMVVVRLTELLLWSGASSLRCWKICRSKSSLCSSAAAPEQASSILRATWKHCWGGGKTRDGSTRDKSGQFYLYRSESRIANVTISTSDNSLQPNPIPIPATTGAVSRPLAINHINILHKKIANSYRGQKG